MTLPNDQVVALLKAAFETEDVELVDNSWRHAGHAAMSDVAETQGTHIAIRVTSAKFDGVSLINRHRMVHEALKPAFEAGLHALEVKAISASEAPCAPQS